MDCREMCFYPINPLPAKCTKCGFPDLEFVPQPYFLVKSRTMTPNELALAENGNLFIRERVHRLFELLIPGLCTYYPTCYQNTSQAAPWLLAVPNRQVVQANVKPAIPRCEVCGEPRFAHPGTQWDECLFGSPMFRQTLSAAWSRDSEFDILKSATWGSSERGWNRWMSRSLFMSVRLMYLLAKAKAKGVNECTTEKPLAPNKDESAWIREKLQLLEANGIPLHAEGTLSAEDAKWFREYIATHARNLESNYDIKAIERKLKAKLPKSYLDFITSVGSISFENVDSEEGFTVSICTPTELEFAEYTEEFHDEESRALNALTFATTGHGDCFCFDVQKGKKEYPVYLYKHECNFFEPYAENFVACIKRFAVTNGG
jgi:hypothetical protein